MIEIVSIVSHSLMKLGCLRNNSANTLGGISNCKPNGADARELP